MALVNEAKKEINAKIVYIGQKGAGKGTALRYIYSKLKPECRSDLKGMTLGGHQLLFFDFSYPAPSRTEGYSIRFHVYTLLAGDTSPPPWKMLLKGVDGVVLLADSTDGRMYGNLESCTVLLDSLTHYGRHITDIALSLQCNKRDLKGALPAAVMAAELASCGAGAPLPVIATTGEGLLEGLKDITRSILVNLGQEEPAGPESSTLTATADVPQAADDAEEALDHCPEAGPEFTVQTAGDPVVLNGSTVEIPLRLKGAACGKCADFKVTVSVTI